MRVTYKINNTEIVHEDIVDISIYPEGCPPAKAYIIMKKWSKGFNRWDYPHVYSKPDSIFIEEEK